MILKLIEKCWGGVVAFLILIAVISGCSYTCDRMFYDKRFLEGAVRISFIDGSDTTLTRIRKIRKWGGDTGGLFSGGWAHTRIAFYKTYRGWDPLVTYQLTAIKTWDFAPKYHWTLPYHFWHTKGDCDKWSRHTKQGCDTLNCYRGIR